MVREVSKQKILKCIKKHKRLNYTELKKRSGLGNSAFATGIKEIVDEEKIVRQEVKVGNQSWVFYSLPEVEKFEKSTLDKIKKRYEALYKWSKAIRDDNFLKPPIGKPFTIFLREDCYDDLKTSASYEYNIIKNMHLYEEKKLELVRKAISIAERDIPILKEVDPIESIEMEEDLADLIKLEEDLLNPKIDWKKRQIDKKLIDKHMEHERFGEDRFFFNSMEEFNEDKRRWVLHHLTAIIFLESQLKIMVDLIPTEGKYEEIIKKEALEMHTAMNQWIREIRSTYDISNKELFDELQEEHDSKWLGDLDFYHRSTHERDFSAIVNFDPQHFLGENYFPDLKGKFVRDIIQENRRLATYEIWKP